MNATPCTYLIQERQACRVATVCRVCGLCTMHCLGHKLSPTIAGNLNLGPHNYFTGVKV